MLIILFTAKRFFETFHGNFTKSVSGDATIDGNGQETSGNGETIVSEKNTRISEKIYAKQKIMIDAVESSLNCNLLDSILANFAKSRVFIPVPSSVKSRFMNHIKVSLLSIINTDLKLNYL